MLYCETARHVSHACKELILALHFYGCRCARCLGLLGAIDPAHVSPELPRPAPFAYDAKFCLVTLIQQHLVRVLQTACDIGQLEVTSYAIQQILQHYTKRQLAKAVRSTQVCLAVLAFCWVGRLVTAFMAVLSALVA